MAAKITFDTQSVTGVFQLNSFEQGNQGPPQVIALKNGGFVVTYYNDDTGQNGYDIFNASYERVGGGVINNPGGSSSVATVAELGNGKLAFALGGVSNGGVGPISVYTTNADGTGLTKIASPSVGAAYTPYITAVGTSGYTVTWENTNLTLGSYTNTGSATTSQTIADRDEFFDRDRHYTTIDGARFSDGTAIVVATELNAKYDSPYDDNNFDDKHYFTYNDVITVSMIGPGGNVITWGEEHNPAARMSIGDMDVQYYQGQGYYAYPLDYQGHYYTNADQPAVAVIDDSKFAIAYRYEDGVEVEISGRNLAHIKHLVVSDGTSTSHSSDPDITVLSNGLLVVSYDLETLESYYDQDDNLVTEWVFQGSFYTVVAADGSVMTAPKLVPIDPNGGGAATFVGLGEGKFVAVWADNYGDSSANRIAGEVETIVRITEGDGTALTLTGDGMIDIYKKIGSKNVIDGGNASDTVDYSDKTVSVEVKLDGATQVDVLLNGVKTDKIKNIENVIGGSAADKLTGDSAANSLKGGDGDDWLRGGGGKDTLDGGAGKHDTADYGNNSASRAISVDLNGNSFVTVKVAGKAEDSISGIENVTGGDGNDSIVGDGADNLFVGGQGNDTLKGDAGNDTLRGGAGADKFDGGTGLNLVTYAGSAAGVTADMLSATAGKGDAAGDTFAKIQNLTGSSHDDVLRGTDSANSLVGGDGDDTLRGREGKDTLNGGKGLDVADFTETTQEISLTLDRDEKVRVSIEGSLQDTLVSIEGVIGGGSRDRLTGDSGANIIKGGADDDTLNGGLGKDTLTGNSGNDHFVFNTKLGSSNVDLITDFEVGKDHFRLENALMTKLGSAGDLAQAAFRANADGHDATNGSQRIIYDKSDGTLWYDADGNKEGGVEAIKFAVLGAGTTHPAITFHDFLVI